LAPRTLRNCAPSAPRAGASARPLNFTVRRPSVTTGDLTFDTIRHAILTRPPKLGALVRERFLTDPAGDCALAFALEFHVRSVPGFGAIDGWRLLRVVHQTSASMRVVAIAYVLPTGEIPVEIEFTQDSGSVSYSIRKGIEDPEWASLSDSKRWNAVYLYATGQHDERWTWSEPASGYLKDA
jgi:hypothetical protein